MYFETCRSCIIPRRGFGTGRNETGFPNRPPPENCTVTGQTSVSGKVSYVEIKFYVYNCFF